MHYLCQEIESDLQGVLVDLKDRHFVPRNSIYDPQAFGNYYVDFIGPNKSFRIVKDRSQYMLEGDRHDLEPFGLWRAFDNREEFAKALFSWLTPDGNHKATSEGRIS
jgi:hypothetical protein